MLRLFARSLDQREAVAASRWKAAGLLLFGHVVSVHHHSGGCSTPFLWPLQVVRSHRGVWSTHVSSHHLRVHRFLCSLFLCNLPRSPASNDWIPRLRLFH